MWHPSLQDSLSKLGLTAALPVCGRMLQQAKACIVSIATIALPHAVAEATTVFHLVDCKRLPRYFSVTLNCYVPEKWPAAV